MYTDIHLVQFYNSREPSTLQESNSNLSYLQVYVAWKYLTAERDVGYSWNFFAMVSFVSLPALQGLHQPRKKVKSVYWNVISIMLKYFQEKAILMGTLVFYVRPTFHRSSQKKKRVKYFSNEASVIRLLLTIPLLHQALCL